MFFTQAGTVALAAIEPLGELRHGAVVKDAGSSPVASETPGFKGRLPHFLAAVKHDGPLPHRKQDGGHRFANLHTMPAPGLRVGKAHFVVVFGVAQRLVEARSGEGEGIEIIGPLAVVVNPFERVVHRIVIDRIESRPQQFIEHVAMTQLGRIIVISLGKEIDRLVALATALHHPAPELHGNHVRHVTSKSIHPHVLPIG